MRGGSVGCRSDPLVRQVPGAPASAWWQGQFDAIRKPSPKAAGPGHASQIVRTCRSPYDLPRREFGSSRRLAGVAAREGRRISVVSTLRTVAAVQTAPFDVS
jgi:hypothetical protein